GTLSVRTNNDYSGGTTINQGTIEMGSDPGGAYSPTGAVNISTAGFTFFDKNRDGNLGTGTIYIGSQGALAYRATAGFHQTNLITGPGPFYIDAFQGAIELDTPGQWLGGTTLNVGYLRLGINNALPSTGSFVINTIPHPTRAAVGGAGGRFDL